MTITRLELFINQTLKTKKFIAWKIYSIVTDLYHSNHKRMRDWITNPRSTGYESLHLTVLGPDKKWIEVQIRFQRMDEIAEKGVAAIINTKKASNKTATIETLNNGFLRLEVIEQQQNLSTSQNFLDNIKLNLYSKEVLFSTKRRN